MNLAENFSIVEAITPQAGAAITGDYISLKKAGHVSVIVHINQANAATVAITLEQATAVAGTGSKAIATEVPIFLCADAATSDLLVAQTPAVDFTTSAATKHKIVIFEVDAEDLDIAGGFDCLTVKTGASNAANITSAVYVVGLRRYGSESIIVD
jgi:hypothetical protein